jgi:hypothetical protein
MPHAVLPVETFVAPRRSNGDIFTIMQFATIVTFFAGLLLAAGAVSARKDNPTMELNLTSPAFEAGQSIPALHTCEGSDISPPLAWAGISPEVKSLALILDDPDAPDPAAPQRTWVHWVLYNIPPNALGLKQGVTASDLPPGTHEGLNDWKRTGYGGPCPPVGRHRYIHKLYALDIVLPDLGKATKGELEKAMEGHVIAKAELVGTYQKKK